MISTYFHSNAIDLAMLLIRLAIGPMLIAHGYNKIFGAGGLEGTAGWFEGLGLKPGWLHARVAAFTEISVGIAVTIGLLTPLASAGVIGLMVVAMLTDHRGKGYFVFKGGWEYVLFVAITAAALASAGPGRWSVDNAINLGWFGVRWAVVAVVLGVGAALLMLATSYRPAKKP
ncbi:MAG: DoxX family protein [Candidatus Nanopelagicales bacterium]|nr:DoxX family protein [Candidatus Nanopelagicales bacterium]